MIAMEQPRRKHQLGIWRPEARQGVHWCDLGLWGSSTGRGSFRQKYLKCFHFLLALSLFVCRAAMVTSYQISTFFDIYRHKSRLLTQWHLISSTKSYWPGTTKCQPVPPSTDPVPPSIIQHRPVLTQPSYINQYHHILPQYHQVPPHTDPECQTFLCRPEMSTVVRKSSFGQYWPIVAITITRFCCEFTHFYRLR